tara:strand:+ start:982 stop:1599 length:618 start_codon:yes stop_codon:yes gene_type:complete
LVFDFLFNECSDTVDLINISIIFAATRDTKDANKKPMAFTIFFATSTGKTEDVADRLKELIPGAAAKDVDNLSSADELAQAEALICCVPTWNTGADEARSGTAWDDHVQEIPNLDFAGKPVAIVGLGDSSGYSDYFCDAMEELYTAFLQAGAKLIGKVPTDSYTFDESKSVIDGKFCGLAIDEDNESELTDERLSSWVQQINAEA